MTHENARAWSAPHLFARRHIPARSAYLGMSTTGNCAVHPVVARSSGHGAAGRGEAVSIPNHSVSCKNCKMSIRGSHLFCKATRACLRQKIKTFNRPAFFGALVVADLVQARRLY